MTLSLDRIDFTVETKPTNITKLEISNSLSFCARALLIVTINYVETPKKHLNSLFWKNHKKTIVNHVKKLSQPCWNFLARKTLNCASFLTSR